MHIHDTALVLRSMILESDRYINKDTNIGDFFLLAATLDKKGRIIAIGENSVKTHPLMRKYGSKVNLQHKIYLHAEVSAMVKSYQQAHSILVIRLNRAGEFAMAKPCLICQMAIHTAKIKHIYYSDQDGDIVYLESKKIDNVCNT